MTKKEIERIYDDLYDRADKLFKKYNPCQFNPQTGLCKAYPDVTNGCDRGRAFILCCGGCHYEKKRKHQHSLKSGCRVKSLGCKLYYCFSQYQDTSRNLKIDKGFEEELGKIVDTYGEAEFYGSVYVGKRKCIDNMYKCLLQRSKGAQ